MTESTDDAQDFDGLVRVAMLAARPSLGERAAYAIGGAVIAVVTLRSFWLGVGAGVLIAGFWQWLDYRARRRILASHPQYQSQLSAAAVSSFDHLGRPRATGTDPYSQCAVHAARACGAKYLVLVAADGCHGDGISVVAADISDLRAAQLAWDCRRAAHVLLETRAFALREGRTKTLEGGARPLDDGPAAPQEPNTDDPDDAEQCVEVGPQEESDESEDWQKGADQTECIVCGQQWAVPGDSLGWCSRCIRQHEEDTDGRAPCDGCGQLALEPIEALLCSSCARSTGDKVAFMSEWRQLIRAAVGAAWDEVRSSAERNENAEAYAAGARTVTLIMERQLHRALDETRQLGTPIENHTQPADREA